MLAESLAGDTTFGKSTVAMTYRFTAHTQLKLQYTLQDQPSGVQQFESHLRRTIHSAVLIRRA